MKIIFYVLLLGSVTFGFELKDVIDKYNGNLITFDLPEDKLIIYKNSKDITIYESGNLTEAIRLNGYGSFTLFTNNDIIDLDEYEYFTEKFKYKLNILFERGYIKNYLDDFGNKECHVCKIILKV